MELVFGPGSTQGRECGAFSLIDDLIVEATEMFNVLLNTFDSQVNINDTASSSVIVITDSDGM